MDAAESWERYLASRLKVPVVNFYGRSAGLEETKCLKQDAVYYWWKDMGIPYMTLPCHAEDTVFFVFESDFRFYREEAELRLSTVGQGVVGRGSVARFPYAKAGSPALPVPHPDLKRLREVFETSYEEYSVEYEDMVSCVNQAARMGHGEVVWMGYNAKWYTPGSSGVSQHAWDHPYRRMQNGAQLIAITCKAAHYMKKKFSATLVFSAVFIFLQHRGQEWKAFISRCS